jgi:hypothetical protein
MLCYLRFFTSSIIISQLTSLPRNQNKIFHLILRHSSWIEEQKRSMTHYTYVRILSFLRGKTLLFCDNNTWVIIVYILWWFDDVMPFRTISLIASLYFYFSLTNVFFSCIMHYYFLLFSYFFFIPYSLYLFLARHEMYVFNVCIIFPLSAYTILLFIHVFF